MRILRLTLHQYKRFLLNDIKHLEIDLTSDVQLIIGSNGSGKSSLIRQFSPLPAVRADFRPGGYKDIVIEHNDNQYRLTSKVSASGVRSDLIRNDNEVLAEHATSSVINQLVLQEFNYWQGLHDVLIGDIVFTQMSPTLRREWITRISGLNLDYGLKLHKAICSAHRDAVGAFKHVSGRLGSEKTDLIDDITAAKLSERASALEKMILSLVEHKDPKLGEVCAITSRIDQKLNQIQALSTDILAQTKGWTYNAVKEAQSIHDYEQLIGECDIKIAEHKAQLASWYREIQDIRDTLLSLEQSGIDGQKNLVQTKADIQAKLSALPEVDQKYTYEGDLIALHQDASSILQVIQDYGANVAMTVIAPMSLATYESQLHEQKTIKVTIDKIRSKLTQISARVSHIKDCQSISCPACQHQWIPGIKANEREQLTQEIDQSKAILAAEQAQLAKLDETTTAYETYQQQLRQWRDITAAYPRLRWLWSHVQDNDLLAFGVTAIAQVADHYLHAIGIEKQREEYKHELEVVNATIRKMNGSQGEKPQSLLTSRCRRLQSQIDEHNGIVESLEVVRTNLLQRYRKVKWLNEQIHTLTTLIEQLHHDKDLAVRTYRNKGINDSILTYQKELNAIDIKLSEQKAAQRIVGDLQANAMSLQEDMAAWKLLITALSPTDGMIAEQLIGFINTLTHQLNDIIGRIWKSDLNIISCNLDDGDLDYKFPLQIAGSPDLVPDIRDGSTAQKDVVNFAFVLVTMLYLELHEYPVFADEIGNTFDNQHFQEILRFLKTMLDSNQCSQLFIISHAFSVSNQLANAQVCVLDKSNITVPGSYNEHVNMQ